MATIQAEENLTTVTAFVRRSQRSKLVQRSRETGLSMSEQVREALQEYFERLDGLAQELTAR